MSYELKVPDLGESITEVQVSEWLKAEGDAVEKDEPVVVLETDKASVDLPAPEAGILEKILKADGELANVGDALAVIADGTGGKKKTGKGAGKAKKKAVDEAPAAPAEAKRVMPAADRVLAQAGVETSGVEGTGPGGRVLKEDAVRATKGGAPKATAPAPKADSGGREEEVVPMSMLRRRTAEKLLAAQHGAALLTTFNEIDMSAVMTMRKLRQDAFVAKHGIKLGFMSFFVKAAVDALKLFPGVNGSIRDDAIVYHNYYDVGVAIGGGKGLVVPIIRNADRIGFADIEKTIADMAERARSGRLELDELQGGTFTISNGGVYGSLMSTPIVNPPQSGVLGLHKIEDRPVALGGEVVIRPMMYVALTYDHRIVDGREAVSFLKRIKEVIEDPSVLLLEV